MGNKKITHLSFDFFGTLVGYTPGHFSIANKYSKSHNYLLSNGIQIDYETYNKNYSEAFDHLTAQSKIAKKEFHMRDVTKNFFSKYLKTINQSVADEFTELYISEWNEGVALYPQMPSFLRNLKNHYNLSIISNTHYPSLVHRNLEAMNVADYFDEVITSVEYGIPKPDSRIFAETLSKLSISKENILYIGDSYNDDYVGATDVGIKCILIDPNHKNEGVVATRVDSIFDIENFL